MKFNKWYHLNEMSGSEFDDLLEQINKSKYKQSIKVLANVTGFDYNNGLYVCYVEECSDDCSIEIELFNNFDFEWINKEHIDKVMLIVV